MLIYNENEMYFGIHTSHLYLWKIYFDVGTNHIKKKQKNWNSEIDFVIVSFIPSVLIVSKSYPLPPKKNNN